MDKKKMTALKRAIKMEEEGKKFYLAAAAKAKNGLTRSLFQELARQEDNHERKIEEIYGSLSAGEKLTDWVTAVNPAGKVESVFKKSLVRKVSASAGEIKALELGMKLEEKSIKYYEELAAGTRSAAEKRFFLALSLEEREHYLKLMDSIEYLTDPEAWLRMKGGANLDGG